MTDGAGVMLEILPDRNDRAVCHMHVGIGDVAGLVHRHDIGVADDERAARRQRARPPDVAAQLTAGNRNSGKRRGAT